MTTSETNQVTNILETVSEDDSFIQAAETLERAARILRMMAEEDKPLDVTGYAVDPPPFLPNLGVPAIMHVEPTDWPVGERNEHTAEAAHATHDWDAEKQDCRKCGIPHPVFVAQGWPVCQG